MRFFKLHDDEIYAVVDASAKVQITLILARGLSHLFGDGKCHVELEGYSWRDFRENICKGCDKLSIHEDYLQYDGQYLCNECPKEVIPK